MMKRKRTRAAVAGAAAVLVVLGAGGCSGGGSFLDPPRTIDLVGYTTRPLFRDDVRTVAVPVFKTGRNLFRRGLEMRLTEAVIREIETCTPYKVVPRERADTVLEGKVLALRERVLTETPRNRPREVEVTVSVEVTWRDLRTGEVLREAKRLSENATFVVDVGETEAMATTHSFDRLARRIVELMERGF